MKLKNLVTLALLVVTGSTAATNPCPSDTLSYKVMFHWGFIDKQAGQGRVVLHYPTDSTLTATLNGHSIPWEGRRYSVADTLHATFANGTETVTFINGRYSKPPVINGKVQPSEQFRNIHGQGTLNASPETMEAVTITAQMLGMFKIAKGLDFKNMQSGQVVSIPIRMPGGAPAEHVKIQYLGETVTSEFGAPSTAYHIVFTYSYRGQTCNYPVDCLVDAQSRVLLKLSSTLIIGHLEMVLDV